MCASAGSFAPREALLDIITSGFDSLMFVESTAWNLFFLDDLINACDRQRMAAAVTVFARTVCLGVCLGVHVWVCSCALVYACMYTYMYFENGEFALCS